MEREEVLTVKTPFGKKYGWEIQRLKPLTGELKPFYRVTSKYWCHPAKPEEVQLWLLLQRARPELFKAAR